MGNFIDMTGQKYGKLEVVKMSEKRQGAKKRICWECKCDCGKNVTVCGEHLRSGHTTSCGCKAKEFTGENLSGRKYGRLTVKKFVEKKPSGRRHMYMWECVCECGNTCVVSADAFKSGNTISCGCYAEEVKGLSTFKHGEKRTRLYNVWNNMRQRCENPNDKSYCFYGAKGIKVCDEWTKDYRNFSEWAKNNGYQEGLQLDRIDYNGNYCPENCRFITQKENENNRRDNVIVEYREKQMTLSQYAELRDYDYDRLRYLYVDCKLKLQEIDDNDYMNKPYKRQSKIMYEYKGEFHTLQELSKMYNVDYVTLQSRVRSLKWDIARAIEEPKHTKCINERYK